jgi:pimeloyl-ACP methyl ester carboxylesterase
MKLSTRFRALAGAKTSIAMTFICACAAAAQTIPAQGFRNVVLVHGAWADGSSWAGVIPLLEARGLNVVAVQLPLTSLADDVATTERAIALQEGPVLLVGHSYGGVVISEAGNDPKVGGLVFVSAFAPDEGESALSLSTANPSPVGNELRPDANGFLKLSAKGIEEDFAQDLTADQKKVLAATQGPTASAAFGTPVSNPAWKNKPTWFVVSRNDRVISPQLEENEAQRMRAIVIKLPTSHVSMLAAPGRVAAFIEKAAFGRTEE